MLTSPFPKPVTPPFTLRRQVVLMEPNEDDPLEAEGVLNPASARSRDGQLICFHAWWRKGITPASALRV